MNVLRTDFKVKLNVAFLWTHAEGKHKRVPAGDGSKTKMKLFHGVIKWVTFCILKYVTGYSFQSFSVLTRTGFSMSLGLVYDHRKGYDGNYFDINYSKYIILMKRTRLLDLKKDMFRQLLCHRQFTDGIKMMKNI